MAYKWIKNPECKFYSEGLQILRSGYILTTVATLSLVIPFIAQYLPFNQSLNSFDPLLALQDPQQSAMLSCPLIRMSLIMCSHVGLVL